MTTITAVNIAAEIVEDNYPDPVYGEDENNWVSYRLEEAWGTGSLDGDRIRVMLEAAAQQGYDAAQQDSLARVKTAFHRLADRVAIPDENEVKVPLSEILMYTPENRANIARMLRREADSF